MPKSELRPTATTESTCSENDKESTAAANGNNVEKTENGNDEPAQKKQRLSNREYKKMKKGQNKVKLVLIISFVSISSFIDVN